MGDTLYDADLIIIGGGPAGCAAARMAAGVGMRSILVEPDRLCRNLYRIPALNNLLGGYTTAPPGDLARGADGYCPPTDQHPRIIVAGGLRSARFQRIMTALGSGSEAALRASTRPGTCSPRAEATALRDDGWLSEGNSCVQ